MFTVLILILVTVAASAIAFLALRKPAKVEAEPLGYETSPVAEPVVEITKNKKPAKKAARPKTATKKTSTKTKK